MFLESFCDVLHNDLNKLNPGHVNKQIEKLDAGKRAYGWLPLMASSAGGQIGAWFAESFCKRTLSEANDVCHEWIRFSIQNQHVGCVAYESRIHTTLAWNLPKVERSTSQQNMFCVLLSIGGHSGAKLKPP